MSASEWGTIRTCLSPKELWFKRDKNEGSSNVWKKIILIMIMPGFALASSADCYRIKDKDAQKYCLATTGSSSAQCYSIHNDDQKKLCLAETQSNSSVCYQIKDKDMKNLCLAKVRR